MHYHGRYCISSIYCFINSLHRKKLFESVNYFIHLNLSFTLLAAFIVFVFGIELGNQTTVSKLF